jgi:hypothetical protein
VPGGGGESERSRANSASVWQRAEAIVLLDRGEAHAALDLLTAAPADGSSWRVRLWHQWTAALRAGALLRGDADGVLGTAAAFAYAGYPYQQARTLALAAAPLLGPGPVK